MPLPEPGEKESKEDFVSRFMSNESMKSEYPDEKQRVAVAYSQWKKKNEEEAKGKEVKKIDCELPVSIREQEGEFYVEGFVATTHPDRFKEDNYDGTMMSRQVLETVKDAINTGKPKGIYYAGSPRAVSLGHDWIVDNNLDAEIAGIAIPPAEIRATGDGHYGVWVRTHLNKNNPEFEKTKYDIEQGYIPGFSFEFIEGDSEPITIGGRLIKFIKNIKESIGYAFASLRKIANPQAIITGFGYREVENILNKDAKTDNNTEEVKKEEIIVADKEEKESVEVVPPKDLNNNLPTERTILNNNLNGGDVNMDEKTNSNPVATEKPVMSVREVVDMIKNSDEFKDAVNSVEIKSRVIKADSTSQPEVRIREINECIKKGDTVGFRQIVESDDMVNKYFNNFKDGNYNIPISSSLKVRCVGKGLKLSGEVKVRSTLDTATNGGNYTLSGVEFPDLFAPGIIDTFNNQANLFGFLGKEEHIGGYNYNWKLITNQDPDSLTTFVDRDDVTVGKTESTKYNMQTPIKIARRGVSVTDFTLRYASKSLGDLFQLELGIQMNKMMKAANQSLFAEMADGTGNNPLGLEAVADAAGNTTLYGYTRSAANRLAPDTAANTYDNISASVSEAKLRSKYDYLETEGAQKGNLAIVTSPVGRSYIFNLLDGQRQFLTTSVEFGFNRMTVPMHDGIPIIVDSDCASTLGTIGSATTCAYIIDTDSDKIVIAMAPTIISLAKVGAGTEAYIEMHFAHVYKQPRRISMINSITGPST